VGSGNEKIIQAFETAISNAADSSKHTYIDHGLVNGLEYHYQLKAIDKAGNESDSTGLLSVQSGVELEAYTTGNCDRSEYEGATIYIQSEGLSRMFPGSE